MARTLPLALRKWANLMKQTKGMSQSERTAFLRRHRGGMRSNPVMDNPSTMNLLLLAGAGYLAYQWWKGKQASQQGN